MNVLFLDIDGVLNNLKENCFVFKCPPEKYGLSNKNCKNLDDLLAKIPSVIVLLTSWRNYSDDACLEYNGGIYRSLLPIVKQRYSKYIFGCVPHVSGNTKQKDLLLWFEKNGSCHDFVILDDDSTQNLQFFGDRWIHVDRKNGLTKKDCNTIIKYFKTIKLSE